MKLHKGIYAVLACFFALFLFATKGYSHTITAGAGAGGTISPSGAVTVPAGADQTFSITPDPDHGVFDVVVDSVSMGRVLSYTFSNVAADHDISASFFDCALFPVMLDWDGSLYGTIMEAYDFAAIDLSLSDFTLMLRDGIFYEFPENLIFDAGASVLLDGGYDCSFLDNSMITRISGSLTVTGGTVTASNIVLSGALPCDGTDPNNFPGNPETCDGQDNNCNGIADDGLGTDADNDGHYTTDSCSLTFTPNDDCDDNDPNNFPGNPEICDGFDNNCDGQADEGLVPTDADGDGYTSLTSCGGSADDCNDSNPNINPGAIEIFGDGIDQNCDGKDVSPSEQVCFGCHGYFWTDQVHQRDITPDDFCIDCHGMRAVSVRSGHYDETVVTPGNNMTAGSVIACRSCHDWHADENGPYEGFVIPGANFVWAKVTAVGRPNITCYTCHENLSTEHESAQAHNNRVIDTLCANCHTSDTSVLGQPGTGTLITDADINALHTFAGEECLHCHAYSGTEPAADIVYQAIQDGFAGNPISCLDCHGVEFPAVHAFIQDHGLLIRVGTTGCGDCHSDPPPLIDPVNPKVHSSCSNCHDENYNRISLAAGKTFAAGGDCTTCHGNHFPNHTHHNGEFNDVSYNANVDTSQSSQEGCSVCHHDYDSVNGTSLGLTTWETILVEHDLDGAKDGSTNTCDNCHAYDGSSSAPLAAVQNAIASGNPATCATCHTDKVPDVDHGVPTSGKHADHLALPDVSCGNCHMTGNYPYFKSGTDSNGDGLYDLTETDVCYSCHQDATGNPAPDDFKLGWSNPVFVLDCSGCHAATPATASHTPHLSLTGCGSCHDGTVVDTTAPEQHMDQNIDVYDITPADLGYPADKAIASPYGSCSSSYCHSTVQGVTDPTDPPTYVTSPVWGTPFGSTEATCTGCHDSGGHVGDASSPLTTGSHARHLNFRFDQDATCNACHFDWSYTGCTTCHERQVNHVDNSIDVMFKPDFPLSATSSSGAYTGDPAPRTSYGSCSALYCHSPGTKASAPYDDPNITGITWGGSSMPADCTGCHDGDSAAVQSMATGSHGLHITNYDCSKCHAHTVDNSRSLNTTVFTPKNYTYGQRYHVDGWVTVAFSSDIATSGAYAGAASPTLYRAPGSAVGSCDNTYCHSDGSSVSTTVIPDNTSPDWGSGSLACDGCHSYGPDYPNGTPKANNHAAHGSYSCDACHYSTTTTGDTITGAANHANQAYDVQAGSGVSFSYTFDSNGGTCSSISCHGGSGAAWGASVDHSAIITGGTTGCTNASCHSNPPPLVNASDPLVHNSCTTCHDANGDLISLAEGKTAPGDCITCHGNDLSTLHPSSGASHIATPGSDYVLIWAAGTHDSAMIGDGTVYMNCTTCHSTNLGNVHDNNCSTCHPSPADTVIGTWTGGCQQGGCHTTRHEDNTTAHFPVEDQCTLCHGVSYSDFPPLPTSCANCHATYNPADTVPPVTTSNAQAFYIVPISIDFTITDNGGKVGIGTTYSRVDGGPLHIGSSIYVDTVGMHMLEFWSVDQAGNVESPPNTVMFEIAGDTTPPVTTSNALSSYYTPANITLTATDNSYLGPKTTYYLLNSGPTQTGTSVYVPELDGTFSYTLQFWSDDWSGNVEAPPNTVNFTIYGGTGTLRLVWNSSDTNGSPCAGSPSAAADWTIRRNNAFGTIVATGSGACPSWSGVDDVVVDVSPTPYHVVVDWWNVSEGFWDQTSFGNIYISTHGDVSRLSY